MVDPRDWPRGIMVTLCRGWQCSSKTFRIAWPASCHAVRVLSSSLMARLRRSRPQRTLSRASSSSIIRIRFLFFRAANKAASFKRLANSAPEYPGVPRAMTERSTSLASFTFLAWTLRMDSRPRTSGSGTVIWRSNRPGRSSAGSRTSGRLVAAMIMMPSWESKPSISTSSALSVCSRSSLPPPKPCPRCRPTASISSINTKHGVLLRACSNISRTRLAPTPTNISTKSEPLMLKKSASASPAMALAISVLPVPGEPTIRMPFGMRPPSFWNFLESFRKSTNSKTSSLASSTPATSLNVILFLSLFIARALLLPKFMAPLPAILICRMKKK